MMTTTDLLTRIEQGVSLFAIVDPNQYQDSLALFKLIDGMEFRPLFRGTPYQELIPHSPKIVKLTEQSRALIDDVFRCLSGCVVASNDDIDQLNQTLGEMLLAEHDSEGKVFMRFFAPAMAHVILNSPELSHCWRGCSQVWLPCYKGEQWLEFDKTECIKPSTLRIAPEDSQAVITEHLAYLLAKTKAWQNLTLVEVKLAAQSLAKLTTQETLSAKKMMQWAEWLALHTSIMTEPSWLSLLNNPISNNEKWQSAQTLVSQSAEITHV